MKSHGRLQKNNQESFEDVQKKVNIYTLLFKTISRQLFNNYLGIDYGWQEDRVDLGQEETPIR